MKIPAILKKKYVIVILVVLIAGGYYWYSKSNSGTKQVQYVTEAAAKGTLTTSITGSGNVIVDQSSNIDPTITGTVSNLAVNVGDKVKKGQLLFVIDNNDLSVSAAKAESSLQSAINSIESAEVQVKSAKADYSDSKKSGSGKSSADKAVLKKKVDIAEDGVTAAEKSYQATLADYHNTLTNAGKRKVVAPISGTVNAVNIKNGDDLSKLSSGSSRQVPIIIGDLGTLKAQVQVNEVDIPNVDIGQKVTMTFSAIDNFTVTGKVEKMDSLGTLTSGVVTFNVTIGFDTLDPRIKPEMSVSAAIITDVKQNVLIVPSGAIKTQNGTSYVEVFNSGQTPVQTTVITGSSNNTETEITSGISAGDKVVTQTINPSATSTASTSSSSSNRNGASSVRIPGLGGGGRPD
jgi:RND family efflux transporter MFP subunit